MHEVVSCSGVPCMKMTNPSLYNRRTGGNGRGKSLLQSLLQGAGGIERHDLVEYLSLLPLLLIV